MFLVAFDSLHLFRLDPNKFSFSEYNIIEYLATTVATFFYCKFTLMFYSVVNPLYPFQTYSNLDALLLAKCMPARLNYDMIK